MTALVDPLRAALVDRYTIERELGRGGMATVYLAHDLKHDRRVALKLLHPELATSLGPERFLREIRLTARLDHPHILPVFDSGEAVGLLWYTMPYVEGESLRDRLRREVQLPVEDTIRIAREVADALDCAHQQGVVHRDIKPENILLARGHARVADFGVARALEAAGGGQITETGLAVGTPAYMSPEQASAGQVDGRSDVYALGCVLYEMLAGEPPYTGPTAQAVIAKRFAGPVPSVRTTRSDVPTALDAVITRALAQVPAARFASAPELAEALARAATSSTTPAAPRIPPREVSRRTLALGGIATVLAVLATAIGVRGGAGARRGEPAGRKMLAVLPLRNLGAPADQYFADGLTEEITSRLASISGLGVISRTSADRYRDSSKPLKEIGRELGVAYVIEGSVRWEKQPDGRSHIRVTPELIRVSDDSHLWTDRYDADLADVFRVQGDIAEQVTKALDVALGAPERRKLAAIPTANLSAYDAYLRGNALYPRDFAAGLDRIVTGLRRASEQYHEAIRLDSTFALAYARLGRAMVDLYGTGPPEPSVAAAAKQAIDRALILAPTLGDARLASGMYRTVVERDTARAVRELKSALAERPNDADLLISLALAEAGARRGRRYSPTSQAISHAERAVLLDPQSADKLLILADMYREKQRFDEAERTYNRVIALDPSEPGAYIRKALVYLLRDGDTTKARAIVRGAAQEVDSIALITAAFTNASTWHALGMLDESYQRAVLTLQPDAFADDTARFALYVGYTYRARGDSAMFQVYYDSALATARAKLDKSPNDPFYLSVMGWTLARRGQRAQAYAAMDRAMTSYGLVLPARGEVEARLAVIAGDYSRALEKLQQGNWGPALTIPWMCVDHFWDPLRSDPRFQRLVNGRCPSSSRPH